MLQNNADSKINSKAKMTDESSYNRVWNDFCCGFGLYCAKLLKNYHLWGSSEEDACFSEKAIEQ